MSSNTKVVYSQKLREALDELRPTFREISQGLDALTKRRAEIAPQFMGAFYIWRRETHRPFIAFVHELDPSMPTHNRREYRQHRSYRAASYLRQLVEQPDKAGRHGLTPLTMLAVAIKSLLPLCHPHEKDALAILAKATRWRERDIHRLIARIQRVKAIGLPKAPRLIEAAKASKAAILSFEREHVA